VCKHKLFLDSIGIVGNDIKIFAFGLDAINGDAYYGVKSPFVYLKANGVYV
jgi:hypothetical protein